MKNVSETYWVDHSQKARGAVAKYLPYYIEACARHPSMVLPQEFRPRVEALVFHYAGFLPYHPGGRSNMFNGLMPVLALMASVHVTLREEGWTVDQIGRLTYEAFYERFMKMPAVLRRIMHTFMTSRLFSGMMRKPCVAMSSSGREDTFDLEYTYSPDPCPTTTMQCSRCGMISFMHRAELTEMYAYCNMFDFAQADAFGLGLVQPACIGRGDKACAYHFTRDGGDTQYPSSVRRILGTDMEM